MHEHADKTRARRQALVLEIIASRDIRTQEQLVAALERRGIAATQSSVSRDVHELGLVKVGGRYRANGAEGNVAEPAVAWRTWLRSARRAGANLIVLRCDIGAAQPVALALDQLSPPGVAGTLAGDDTIFVAVTSAAAGTRLARSLGLRLETA